MIADALLKLLETKHIEKVTITELCETAHVNRSTFYHHYTSQYDVLTEIENSIMTDIVKMLAKVDPDNDLSTRSQIEALCTYLRDNKSSLILFANSNYILHDFSEKMLSLTFDGKIMDECAPKTDNDGIRKLWQSFYQGGYYYLMYSWLTSDFSVSPSEMADLIFKFLSPVLKSEKA